MIYFIDSKYDQGVYLPIQLYLSEQTVCKYFTIKWPKINQSNTKSKYATLVSENNMQKKPSIIIEYLILTN